MIKDKVIFKNFSETDFTYPFDGKNYTFKSGQEEPMDKGEALHFQKHLVDRELTAMEDKRIVDGVGKEIRTNNVIERKKLEDMCIFVVPEEVPAEGTEDSQEETFPGVEK